MTPPDSVAIPAKFSDPEWTARGERRARVAFSGLETLWVNTGTLCNLACGHCYIESSPKNDRLDWFRIADLRRYLDEIDALGLGRVAIGFTGGEPFMNPDITAMIEAALQRGHSVLVLTNAMTPMTHRRAELLRLRRAFGDLLTVRVSLDHFDPALHNEERGQGGFAATLAGLRWLADNGFSPRVAGRRLWGGDDGHLRQGFADLFADEGINIDCFDAQALVLFPEMDETAEVPEITENCWDILKKSPAEMMCANARMVARRKGDDAPVVLACTLIAYEPEFEMGKTLADSFRPVALNHPHCAKFCVLGGGACSRSA
jgi:uncharacterized Fe-S cluster-containing radical SAM superfamily protein